MAAPAPRRELGIWPIVIGAALVILAAVFFFMGADVPDPTPLPDSPAATGTAGEPVGTTGPAPQPGAPAGVEPAAGVQAPATTDPAPAPSH